jgi:N utilization substance protein B
VSGRRGARRPRSTGSRSSGPYVGGRRSARERALGLLYEAETKGEPAPAVLEAQPVAPDPFTSAVVRGVAEHQPDLDALIGRVARGWRIERMPVVDRVVLRMGAFELCHRPDVPTAAAISEAVELAKRFSTDNSGRFVNGVLARIASEYRTDSSTVGAVEIEPTGGSLGPPPDLGGWPPEDVEIEVVPDPREQADEAAGRDPEDAALGLAGAVEDLSPDRSPGPGERP